MINHVTLLGRIGKKESKSTKLGKELCTLSIATNKRFIDASGKRKEITTWHFVNFFHKLADIANKYANVGDLVYISGEINNKKIEDNGVSRIYHSITANEIQIISNNKESPKYKDDNFGNLIKENEDYPF